MTILQSIVHVRARLYQAFSDFKVYPTDNKQQPSNYIR